jgi:putative ABC transport system permease protein
MRANDIMSFTMKSVLSHRLRSGLTSLGIGIGVAAVVLLTSIGEGLHEYMLAEFSQFGTNIIGVSPGKTSTFGTSAGIFNTQRPLTIDDAEALRKVPGVEFVVPVVQGNASVKGNGRERRTTISGVGSDWPEVVTFFPVLGEFLPPDDPRAPRAFAVLGSTLRDELYGSDSPLGQRLRIGGDRYRVIGVMESKGTVLGLDLDDAVYIPAARGLSLFNREGLVEIDVRYSPDSSDLEIVSGMKRMLISRHGGEDFTITTQQQMLEVLGSVLNVVTFAVGALGSISLLVGGVGIFTIMTIAVRERTAEIGLLRAVGALRIEIREVFIGESILLAAFGAIGGLIIGGLIVLVLQGFLPGMPVRFSIPYILASLLVALLIGLIAGVLPAQRAAGLDPVESLRAE